jgi:hypothetical protein
MTTVIFGVDSDDIVTKLTNPSFAQYVYPTDIFDIYTGQDNTQPNL